MKTSCFPVLGVLLSATGTAAGERVEARGRKADPPMATDVAVLTAALEHLSAEKRITWDGPYHPERRRILLHKASGGPMGVPSDQQMDSDTRNEAWMVPRDVAGDLRRRNTASVSLVGPSFGNYVSLIDVVKLLKSRNLRTVHRPVEYPDAKGYATAWLPGYSRDGTQAVARFRFGPTAHGATATYLLARRKDRWEVVKHALAYYV